MEKKKCNMCGKNLPKTEFHVNRALSDGLASRCKKCASIDARKRRNKNLTMTPIEASNDEYSIEGARAVLSGIGYDLSKPIYPQFKERLAKKGIFL